MRLIETHKIKIGMFNNYNTAYLKRQIDFLIEEVNRLKLEVYELRNPPKFKVGDIVSIKGSSKEISGNHLFDGYESSRTVITKYKGQGRYLVDCFWFDIPEKHITLICSVDDRCNQKGAKS